MMLRRLVVGGSLVAVAVMGLSGCGGEKPSGIAPFTPGVTGTASPSTSSKWTAEQQQVIEASLTFDLLVSKYRRGATLDMSALRRVVTEPLATQSGKDIVNGLSAGFILQGDEDGHETRTVAIAGLKAKLTECWVGRSYGVKKSPAPAVTASASDPFMISVDLVRSADQWRVSKSTDGAVCASRER